MVLLTSSTVSVILSSGIVSAFTLLLFLSGYLLQQQSVRNIQSVLRPSTTLADGGGSAYEWTPQLPHIKSGRDTLESLRLIDHKGESHYYASSKTSGSYAYLQLLSRPDPSDICSAIAFFKHLATNSSAASDRLFMYPQSWDQVEHRSPQIAAAISLLRAASVAYNIWLLPIDMSTMTSAGFLATDTRLLRLGQIQFLQYDSVLYLQTPGMLLDTEKLDAIISSRPLPLQHDKRRRESYDNEAWIPMPLRPDRDAELPPVYLITVNSVGRSRIEARGHIPNISLPDFGHLVTGPWGVDVPWNKNSNRDDQPGYVFFQNGKDGRAQWLGNPLFGAWRARQYEVCSGLDLDYDNAISEERL